MKLLDKLQINLAKGFERKLEIDEGKKLAGSVDTLRELKSKEESSLAEWRVKTTAQVRQEIDDLIQERARVESELKTAQEQRDAFNKPLTERENEITKKEEALAEKFKALDDREFQVLTKEGVVGTREVALKVVENHVEELSQGARTLNLDAQDREKRSRTLLRLAEAIHEKASNEYKASNDELIRRGNASALREKALNKVGEDQMREQERLSLRERAIIDREEEFERTIKRK